MQLRAPQRLAKLLCPPFEAGRDRGEEVVHIDGLDPEWQLPAIGTSQQEEVLRQLGEALGLIRRPADGCSKLVHGRRLPQGELELGAEQREGRTELVAGVRNELALPLERRFEPVEHLVQGLAETLQLVASWRNREPLTRSVGRDRRGSPAHRLDLPKGDPRQQIAGARRKE